MSFLAVWVAAWYHHGLIDGQTAHEYEPKGKAAQEVRNLYKQICNLEVMPSIHHGEEKTDEKQKIRA